MRSHQLPRGLEGNNTMLIFNTTCCVISCNRSEHAEGKAQRHLSAKEETIEAICVRDSTKSDENCPQVPFHSSWNPIIGTALIMSLELVRNLLTDFQRNLRDASGQPPSGHIVNYFVTKTNATSIRRHQYSSNTPRYVLAVTIQSTT